MRKEDRAAWTINNASFTESGPMSGTLSLVSGGIGDTNRHVKANGLSRTHPIQANASQRYCDFDVISSITSPLICPIVFIGKLQPRHGIDLIEVNFSGRGGNSSWI